jgi:hypothetical protein
MFSPSAGRSASAAPPPPTVTLARVEKSRVARSEAWGVSPSTLAHQHRLVPQPSHTPKLREVSGVTVWVAWVAATVGKRRVATRTQLRMLLQVLS